MDPSHDGRSGEHAKESFSHKHEDAPPPMAAPPQMMYYQPGYAPHTGYAPQPVPHQGYPPGYAPHPNEYQQQPYHYPAGPYFSNPPNYHKGGASKSLARGFVLCLCLMFMGLFVATLILAILLHPKLPVYTVNSLSVVNFNTTPTLAANWNISIMVQNSNDRLNGLISEFKVDLLHKDGVLAVSYVPDFEMDKNEVKRIDVTPSSNGFSFAKWDLDDMGKEQAGGSVTFTLRMTTMVAFKSSSMSTKSTLVLALCNGLKVVFQNNTGNGALDNAGRPVSCQLYI